MEIFFFSSFLLCPRKDKRFCFPYIIRIFLENMHVFFACFHLVRKKKYLYNKNNCSKGIGRWSFMKSEKQMSDTHFLGLILALVGGFLDAYTYICRGGVFANAQTGNIVLLGIQITSLNWGRALYYFMPVLSFIAGILICELIQTRFKWKESLHWRQLTVLLELFCLAAAGFLPLGKFDTAVNILVSFVCALQVEAFRKMNGNTYATTMCTGNLRSATQNLYLGFREKDRNRLIDSLQYYNVILFFIIGAATGALLTARFGGQSVWVCCLGLLAVFAAMFRK